MEQDTRKTRNTMTRGKRGIRGYEEYEDTRRSKNVINAMTTLHRYKRGHTPRIQKGLKRSTLAWSEIQFVTTYIYTPFPYTHAHLKTHRYLTDRNTDVFIDI